jgi:hypothetical protein
MANAVAKIKARIFPVGPGRKNRERFAITGDNVTAAEKIKECLQGLKPILLGLLTPELKLRPPKENSSEGEYMPASSLL